MTRDLRRYAQQTNFRLLVGFILLLFIIGDGLVYVIWGPGAAAMGALCLIGGLLPLGFIWAVLIVMEWIVRRTREES